MKFDWFARILFLCWLDLKKVTRKFSPKAILKPPLSAAGFQTIHFHPLVQCHPTMAPGHLVRSRKMAHWPHSEKCMMRFNKPVIWPSGKCGAFYKGHLELIWEDISGSEHFRTQLNQTWKQQEINMPYTWPIQKWWVESLGLGKIWAKYARLIKILLWLGHCDFIATPVSR